MFRQEKDNPLYASAEAGVTADRSSPRVPSHGLPGLLPSPTTYAMYFLWGGDDMVTAPPSSFFQSAHSACAVSGLRKDRIHR